MTQALPCRLALDGFCADGEWHDKEEALQLMMLMVPPGQAARKAEYNRVHCLSSPGPRRRPADVVAVGARSVAREGMSAAVGTGQYAWSVDRKQIRRARWPNAARQGDTA